MLGSIDYNCAIVSGCGMRPLLANLRPWATITTKTVTLPRRGWVQILPSSGADTRCAQGPQSLTPALTPKLNTMNGRCEWMPPGVSQLVNDVSLL